jgi:predicted transcriptional regulator
MQAQREKPAIPKSVTTSIRLSWRVRQELEKTASKLHRGKNWVIEHALETYFLQLNSSTLHEEARAQSRLASEADDEISNAFEDNADVSGWEP